MFFNKFIAFATVAASAVSVGFASPTAIAHGAVAAAHAASVAPDASNSNGNVFFCTDVNFSGACILFAITNGVCFNVPNGFNDDISSFGPDAGIGCFLFVDSNCGGDGLGVVRSPGISDLSQFGEFQDSISSFNCAVGE